jgi:osmotically inducible protein OsmC
MKRNATAVWNGSGADGTGHLTTQSATLNKTAYSAKARFGDGKGTNPEELIAAAHAGCFTMALAFALAKEGFTPEELTTKADVAIEKDGDGFTITTVDLTLNAKIPGIDQAKFEAIANGAKAGCPVSKVLKAQISLTATLA